MERIGLTFLGYICGCSRLYLWYIIFKCLFGIIVIFLASLEYTPLKTPEPLRNFTQLKLFTQHICSLVPTLGRMLQDSLENVMNSMSRYVTRRGKFTGKFNFGVGTGGGRRKISRHPNISEVRGRVRGGVVLVRTRSGFTIKNLTKGGHYRKGGGV